MPVRCLKSSLNCCRRGGNWWDHSFSDGAQHGRCITGFLTIQQLQRQFRRQKVIVQQLSQSGPVCAFEYQMWCVQVTATDVVFPGWSYTYQLMRFGIFENVDAIVLLLCGIEKSHSRLR